MIETGFFLGDCMDFMKDVPDGTFDLAIVDPPYGLMDAGMQTGGECGLFESRQFKRSNIQEWDHAPSEEYFKELFRVSKNQIIWGGNYFNLPPCRCFIVWDKLQPFENFSRCEYAWTSFKRPAKIYTQDNRYAGKIHPTQKPIELYIWLLNNYAEPDALILDTHVGSASSLIACHRTGHPFVGYEKDPNYYKAAKARLEAEMAQVTFFDLLEANDEDKQSSLFI